MDDDANNEEAGDEEERDPWDARLAPALAQLSGQGEGKDDAAIEELMAFLYQTAGGQPADADDVASTVLLGLVARFHDDPTPINRPTYYLRRAVRNANLRLAERRGRVEPTDPGSLEAALDWEVLVAGIGKGESARELLCLAFDEALRRGDIKGVQTAGVWLDLDDELQRPPSARQVAVRLKVDHATVLRRLLRLRTYVDQVR